MPEIRLAKESGACFGVERALRLVEEALERPDAKVHTLGALIHNPQVLASLEERGVRRVEDPESQPEGTTIVLRAHGVTPQLEQRAKERGLDVVDATCPYVTKTHRDVERLAADGYQIIVVGEEGHAEVVATMAHAEGSLCVGSPEDVLALAEGGLLKRKVGVVVQTTQTKKLLEQVTSALVTRVAELRVLNTICDATEERQEAACELACEADCMIVVGGRISANTTHLAELCAERCANTHHIEVPDELDGAWFEDCGLIGVTAGASTPASMIDAVMARIRALA